MTEIIKIRVKLVEEMLKYAEQHKNDMDYEYEEFMKSVDLDMTSDQIASDGIEFKFIVDKFELTYGI